MNPENETLPPGWYNVAITAEEITEGKNDGDLRVKIKLVDSGREYTEVLRPLDLLDHRRLP